MCIRDSVYMSQQSGSLLFGVRIACRLGRLGSVAALNKLSDKLGLLPVEILGIPFPFFGIHSYGDPLLHQQGTRFGLSGFFRAIKIFIEAGDQPRQ